MRDSRSTPAVLVIPAALAIFTLLVVALTIRTLGFAVVAAVAVFLVSFVIILILESVMGGRDGRPRHKP